MDINLHFDNETGSQLLLTDDLKLFQQEIELAIKIIEGEIWNRPKNLDINRYLFNKYLSVYNIRNEIVNFITEECEHSNLFEWDLDIKFIKNELNEEFLLINITVYRNEEAYENKFLIG